MIYADMYMLRFKHYESIADVQTLAMLSCVLAEPAALEDASRTMRHLPDEVSSSQTAAWQITTADKPKGLANGLDHTGFFA